MSQSDREWLEFYLGVFVAIFGSTFGLPDRIGECEYHWCLSKRETKITQFF